MRLKGEKCILHAHQIKHVKLGLFLSLKYQPCWNEHLHFTVDTNFHLKMLPIGTWDLHRQAASSDKIDATKNLQMLPLLLVHAL